MYDTDPQTVNVKPWVKPGRAGLRGAPAAPALRRRPCEAIKNELLRPLERHLSLKMTVPHTEHPSASHQCNTHKRCTHGHASQRKSEDPAKITYSISALSTCSCNLRFQAILSSLHRSVACKLPCSRRRYGIMTNVESERTQAIGSGGV